MSASPPREPDGRYAVARLDQICKCGHRLGEHTAARVDGEQPCLESDCPCEVFTAACTNLPTCRVGKGQRHRPGCPGAAAARRTKGGAHKTDRARVSVPLLEELCAAMGVPRDGTPNDMVRAMLRKLQTLP